MKKIEKMKKTQLCNLQSPANCEHRIDGKLSHTILCGNNPLSESYKKCPYKQEAQIVFDNVTQTESIPDTHKEYTHYVKLLEDRNKKLTEVLVELIDSAEYWSEYDVPIGIVDRMKNAIK